MAALTSGSPILPTEIQERVFCLPPSTISSISALSLGLADRAKWASLWVLTATWNWVIRAGFLTYWYSYLLGVEMWILSADDDSTRALTEPIREVRKEDLRGSFFVFERILKKTMGRRRVLL